MPEAEVLAPPLSVCAPLAAASVPLAVAVLLVSSEPQGFLPEHVESYIRASPHGINVIMHPADWRKSMQSWLLLGFLLCAFSFVWDPRSPCT